MDLSCYLAEKVALVDGALDRYLPGEDILPVTLHRAMRYSVFAGGKRLRPVLLLAACQAVGGAEEKALPVACALEMVHTYSLIHDDLPAMDNDDLRRGRPTNHKVFGEATAILAGDALLTQAFLLLSNPETARELSAEVLRQVIYVLARSSGSMGMVGGQIVDMESEGQPVDFPVLEYIHTHKTGALILAAIQCGALIGEADAVAMRALTSYAEAAGLAFQIADDILDVVGDQTCLGKTIGSDQSRDKATYPALIGLAASRERAHELRDLAIAADCPLHRRSKFLAVLVDCSDRIRRK
ncbi:MAG: polyprenyl synthetase family protein [Desulfuromonadaceae bacterium]